MGLALERGNTVSCDNLTLDTGLTDGSWPIYIRFFIFFPGMFTSRYARFLSCMLAHLHWVIFEHVRLIDVGFCLGFHGFLAGFSSF